MTFGNANEEGAMFVVWKQQLLLRFNTLNFAKIPPMQKKKSNMQRILQTIREKSICQTITHGSRRKEKALFSNCVWNQKVKSWMVKPADSNFSTSSQKAFTLKV